MESSDEQLVAAAQRNDVDSFGLLYDRYIVKIYAFIFYRTSHRETAEDLTSLSFTKAFEGIERYRQDKGKFATWLYQIARNTVIDHYRTQKRDASLDDMEDRLGYDAKLAAKADINMTLDKIADSLVQLSDDQRDILIMRLWDGLSHKEIAEILGKSENSSKMAFSRALKRLRELHPNITMLLIVIAIVIVNRRA